MFNYNPQKIKIQAYLRKLSKTDQSRAHVSDLHAPNPHAITKCRSSPLLMAVSNSARLGINKQDPTSRFSLSQSGALHVNQCRFFSICNQDNFFRICSCDYCFAFFENEQKTLPQMCSLITLCLSCFLSLLARTKLPKF